nr:MAG TPA: hypothetical protein [Caudoviricetes sp.]
MPSLLSNFFAHFLNKNQGSALCRLVCALVLIKKQAKRAAVKKINKSAGIQAWIIRQADKIHQINATKFRKN